MPNAKLCADKISSLFLSLYSNDLAPKSRNLKKFSAFFPPFWNKKVAISGICWDISEILTDLESAFKSGSFEHLKTIVAWILATRTFLLTQFLRETFDFVKSIPVLQSITRKTTVNFFLSDFQSPGHLLSSLVHLLIFSRVSNFTRISLLFPFFSLPNDDFFFFLQIL